MKIQKLIKYIEQFAPPAYQESYDNSGLIVGDSNEKITGVILCLDSIEAVIDEAIEKDCNMVIAHHPIVFSGLKRFNGRNYIERVVMKAIKNDIAIYACHTNLDNVQAGVNAKIAEKLGLINTKILAPKSKVIKKLSVYVPVNDADKVRSALFAVGAGRIGNYDEASFNVVGAGTFRANEDANPHVGETGKRHYEAETKIEVIFPFNIQGKVLSAMSKSHPYEEVAYDIVTIDNQHQGIGSGMIGELAEYMEEMPFLEHLKKTMKTDCVRYTDLLKNPVKRVAVCGGSGQFLLRQAISQNADIFITADFKYHQFFDADQKIIIADIGHFESEQFTIDLFYDLITQKFDNFAVYRTSIHTNPVNYL
ncbi:MAG: Nif3-like dinuclear metal center hexameric protein [Saprospiraceae bacterium]